MAINFTGVPPNSQAGGPRAEKTDSDRASRQQASDNAAKPDSGGAAEVRLSDAAQALQAADKSLDATPDVDEARVNALRNAIANGSYSIDARRVAERMMDFESALD